MNAEVKTLLGSRTVWATIISIIATAVNPIFNVTIDAEAQRAIADLALNGVSLISGILAIYYRVKATKKIVPANAMPMIATLLLASGLLMSACSTVKATQNDSSVDQAFYGLVSDFNVAQEIAAGYAKNCKETALPKGCDKHVAVLKDIDRQAVAIIDAARPHHGDPDYISGAMTAFLTLSDRFNAALVASGATP